MDMDTIYPQPRLLYSFGYLLIIQHMVKKTYDMKFVQVSSIWTFHKMNEYSIIKIELYGHMHICSRIIHKSTKSMRLKL